MNSIKENIYLKKRTPKFIWLLFFGLSSLALSMSMVMAIFAPVPLVMMSLSFGRKIGYLSWAIVFLISLPLSNILSIYFGQSAMIQVLGFSMLIALFISECFMRKKHPVKSVVQGGFLFIALSGCLYLALINSGVSPKQLVIEKLQESKEVFMEKKSEFSLSSEGQEQAKILESIINNPEQMAQEVIMQGPIYFIMGIFFFLWLNFYTVLRTYHLYAKPLYIKYSEFAFINFKVPDQVVVLVVLGLGISVYANQFDHTALAYIGGSLLKILGIFYFFQGFGVMISFFNSYKLFGFMRTFLTLLLVFFAFWFIAILGLFDTWADFRSTFNKKLKENKNK